ncbi:hypothetical protein [Acuticoccus mangrovi]|uniref:Uncharacterized protein n=1 Tax=Acuticoccus mangrovi TaxID=2796142 RepID=A0A934MBU4_9HYPH|nr:hypothetical protein [Acuticoccus mangrovi]MBJ3774522.1 hypothetical protein [Acuticoccus mangrovi]
MANRLAPTPSGYTATDDLWKVKADLDADAAFFGPDGGAGYTATDDLWQFADSRGGAPYDASSPYLRDPDAESRPAILEDPSVRDGYQDGTDGILLAPETDGFGFLI